MKNWLLRPLVERLSTGIQSRVASQDKSIKRLERYSAEGTVTVREIISVGGGSSSAGEPTADAHIADTSDAHDASAISNVAAGSVAATTVQAAIDELATDYAAADTTHVGAANPHTVYVLGAAVPGGELGGTYATPTVDATHAGSTHSAATDTHIADPTAAHPASAVSILDTAANFTAIEVEGALAELAAGGSHAEDHKDRHVTGGADAFDQTDLLQLSGINTPSIGLDAGSVISVSLLNVASTTKGVTVFPRMTTAQRDLIVAVEGLCVYNTTTDTIDRYDGATWAAIGGGASGLSIGLATALARGVALV